VMPATMVPSTPPRQKNQAAPASAPYRRASCHVLTSAPWLITTSGTTTADSAAMGAYCRPRCAQCGSVQGLSDRKKKPRVITVTTPRARMVSSVQGSRSSMTGPVARGAQWFKHQAQRHRAGDGHQDVEL